MIHKSGISFELYSSWRDTCLTVLKCTGTTQKRMAEMLDISRQAVSNLLDEKKHHITRMQFLATMYVLAELIRTMEIDSDERIACEDMYTDTEILYQIHGLK